MFCLIWSALFLGCALALIALQGTAVSETPYSRRPRILRVVAVFLYPATTVLTDFVGEFWLNPFFPREDFGLWISNFTIPCCYFAGLFLLARSFYLKYPRWTQQILIGVALLPFYTIAFGIWTFLAYPFGRISSTF